MFAHSVRDLSSLKMGSNAFDLSTAESGTSAATWRGCCKYIELHAPLWIVFFVCKAWHWFSFGNKLKLYIFNSHACFFFTLKYTSKHELED